MTNVPNQPGAYRLEKAGLAIYVGSAKNLEDRYNCWRTNPDNDCVRRQGWDKFVYQPTVTHLQARQLELDWYHHYNPVCNLVTPPGTV
jgi:excinuclease UvrABC nuclease subunit